MDSYQAIYDAVRSRISGGDVGQAMESALREAFGMADNLMRGVAQDFMVTADEQRRPSVVFRPTLSIDGNQWCALYGDNLQDGVAGFGNSPSAAMHDFDRAWMTNLVATPSPEPKAASGAVVMPSLLREPVSSIAELSKTIPGGCYCPPGTCGAPAIMGRQTPCLRRTDVPEPKAEPVRAPDEWRLLQSGERIEAGDEGLQDDCVTWRPIVGWEVGMTYNPTTLVPMRRKVPAAQAKGGA